MSTVENNNTIASENNVQPSLTIQVSDDIYGQNTMHKIDLSKTIGGELSFKEFLKIHSEPSNLNYPSSAKISVAWRENGQLTLKKISLDSDFNLPKNAENNSVGIYFTPGKFNS